MKISWNWKRQHNYVGQFLVSQFRGLGLSLADGVGVVLVLHFTW